MDEFYDRCMNAFDGWHTLTTSFVAHVHVNILAIQLFAIEYSRYLSNIYSADSSTLRSMIDKLGIQPAYLYSNLLARLH